MNCRRTKDADARWREVKTIILFKKYNKQKNRTDYKWMTKTFSWFPFFPCSDLVGRDTHYSTEISPNFNPETVPGHRSRQTKRGGTVVFHQSFMDGIRFEFFSLPF